ncbi:hypothetical protein TELCIR_00570 [Teladorsagia circumcincta]|uniref:Uncharacterized protein n=1 Tax=Teladorsagia circumcincta TaxID=45464 RepID=A0A2G9V4B0_TELCI|nr:hypothetical protein TELCIR_00570 [Teladorsagia circumcincta]
MRFLLVLLLAAIVALASGTLRAKRQYYPYNTNYQQTGFLASEWSLYNKDNNILGG